MLFTKIHPSKDIRKPMGKFAMVNLGPRIFLFPSLMVLSMAWCGGAASINSATLMRKASLPLPASNIRENGFLEHGMVRTCTWNFVGYVYGGKQLFEVGVLEFPEQTN